MFSNSSSIRISKKIVTSSDAVDEPLVLTFNATQFIPFEDWLSRNALLKYFPRQVSKKIIFKRVKMFAIEKEAIPSDITFSDISLNLTSLLESSKLTNILNPITLAILTRLWEKLSENNSQVDSVDFKQIAHSIYQDKMPSIMFGNSYLCKRMISYYYTHAASTLSEIESEKLLQNLDTMVSSLKGKTLDCILFTGGHGNKTLVNQLDFSLFNKIVNILKKNQVSTKCIAIDSCCSIFAIPFCRTLLPADYPSFILAHQSVSTDYSFKNALMHGISVEFNKQLIKSFATNPSICCYSASSETISLLSEGSEKSLAFLQKKTTSMWPYDDPTNLSKLDIKVIREDRQTLIKKLNSISLDMITCDRPAKGSEFDLS